MAAWRNPQVHATRVQAVEDRRSLAVLMMLAAFACFTALDSSAKWLVTEADMSPWAAVFARYAVHLAVVAALVLPAAGFNSLSSRAPGRESLRALFLLCSTLCNFVAVSYLPLTLTATIFFTIPIFVTILSIPILGETVGWRRWLAIGVGFLGILIVTRPWTAEFHWAMGVALGAALCASFYQILTRLLAGIDSTNTQQLYAGLLATLGVAPMAYFNWQTPEGGVAWVLFLTMGLYGWLGHQMLTVAHRYAPASFLAPFIYVQLIFMATSSWIVFHQPPTFWTLIGAPIVVAAGFYIWWRERKLKGA
ncbi:MAG: DMT family transporter [Pseudomonadota bacterium]